MQKKVQNTLRKILKTEIPSKEGIHARSEWAVKARKAKADMEEKS